MPNYFQQKYIQNWRDIVLENEVIHVKSKRAQSILRHLHVEVVRKRETFYDYPKKFLKLIYQLRP